MTENILSDSTIAAMSPAERRDLIARLERPVDELFSRSGAFERIRRVRIGLMVAGSVLLIPWIVYLAFTLPDTYVAHNWTATWVGFDCLLVVFMAATAVLGYLRRQMLVLTAFATGVLLICDAWFDIMTAGPDDMWLAIATAVFGALPLAIILIGGPLRIIRVTATRLWLLEPGARLWRLPLLP
ncbi:hypothetical protein [Mycobacterium shimoidei]|uniref:Uncharacterized protein n=1 Tax=Mycobacterium shimoidei TaxID=29313 RepID=A0A1E3TFY4_MYCSH|nr:hypothetical protein [Mycobacterium shimoidei]MCV7259299.1 hypothetical protein [Mycobacterium shimoidei]ODR13350.1 hypothetical protein BHQ16_11470 [Mycobacterium shimoidei]ORW79689.1 hypothetical protein AWC26_14875 [Mycobacterium shimoidei]SRX93837.1 hypothetical protein MSP7336_02081 [Mycobacterium shimoidei]